MMRVAIVGCGQLSRMLALAGIPLGLKFSFIADANEDAVCVEGLGLIVRYVSGSDAKQLYEDLGRPDCVTIEKEQTESALLDELSKYCDVFPNASAVSVCQHRYQERKLLERLSIPCAPYQYEVTASDSLAELTLPVVVKSCCEGYDGKNQWVLKTLDDVAAFDKQLESDYIIEQWIPFEKELSQVSARSVTGEIVHYALTENAHKDGMLRQSIAPAENVPESLIEQAQAYMCKVLESLNYVGVLAIEFFVVDGNLLVNELAPRVHNSGHWTQSGSITSQFENHLRAITGMTLGSTANHSLAGMVNFIGQAIPAHFSLSPYSTLHWYDKSVRPGRKLGHINVVAQDYASLDERMRYMQSQLADC